MKVISVERCDLMTELVGKMFQWKIFIKDVIQKIDKKSSTNSIRNANNFHGLSNRQNISTLSAVYLFKCLTQ